MSIVWDATPPQTEITSGCFSEGLRDDRVTFTYRLADVGDGLFAYILQRYDTDEPPAIEDLGVWSDFTAEQSATFLDLEPGRRYRFAVLAVDDAGNIEEEPRICEFNVMPAGAALDTVVTRFTAYDSWILERGNEESARLYQAPRPPALVEVRETRLSRADPYRMPSELTINIEFRADPLQHPGATGAPTFDCEVRRSGLLVPIDDVSFAGGRGMCTFRIDVPTDARSGSTLLCSLTVQSSATFHRPRLHL